MIAHNMIAALSNKFKSSINLVDITIHGKCVRVLPSIYIAPLYFINIFINFLHKVILLLYPITYILVKILYH